MTGAVALFIGLLCVAFGSSERNAAIVPGPLSSPHAQVIARGDWQNRCAACHPGGAASATEIFTAGFSSVSPSPHPDITQSSLCLNCHADLAKDGLSPLLAHGLPTEALPSSDDVTAEASSLACAACHQEHHGPHHDLTRITDNRCQSCHADQYGGFAEDHPDFGAWPYERRTRIAFNHASHAGVHFEKAKRDFDCRRCHLPDASGDLTARANYMTSCAECHEADLVASLEAGVPLVALPMLDDDALEGAGRTLRAWPEAARGDFDGELPPLTKLLLAVDSSAVDAFQQLGGPDFSFFDVDADDPPSVEAAADVVDSLRSLLDELQEEGHANLDYRLRKLTGADGLPLADLVSRLPVELVDQLQAVWFSDGDSPLPSYDAVDDRRTGGGWRLDEKTLSLRYRPPGHDDPFLRAWIDVIASLPDEHAELREATLAEFSRPGAPGACLTCHSVDRDAADRPIVHWRGRDRLAEPRAFTFFSHRPHLAQPELADCTRCHQIDPSADLQAGYTGGDPHAFRSEFVSLSKTACVECHRPHAAGDSCTQCHNYHVEAVRPLGR